MNKHFYINVTRKDNSSMVYIVPRLTEQELIQEASKTKDIMKIDVISDPLDGKIDFKINVIKTIYERK